MNAIDILTQILGGGAAPAGKQPSSSPDLGSVFKDIFGGGPTGATRQEAPSSSPTQNDVERSARELEDMLGVGRDRGASVPPSSAPARVPSQPTNWNFPTSDHVPQPLPRTEAQGTDPDRQNQEAVILIRAMIQAAKADGRLSPEEQRAITERIGGITPEVQRFIENEFRTNTDVRDFAWSVPLGLEQKVYSISLTAIDLDTKVESEYLRSLAKSLRISAEVCNQIHQRFGVPALPT